MFLRSSCSWFRFTSAAVCFASEPYTLMVAGALTDLLLVTLVLLVVPDCA